MEDVIAFEVSERKKKESSSTPSGEEKWSVSDEVMALIADIIWKAFYNNPTHIQTVNTPQLVSLLIGVGEVCGGWAGFNAIDTLSWIIEGSSAEQFSEMVEMDVHQRILELAEHSDEHISDGSSSCVTHILNRLMEPGSDSSTDGRVFANEEKRKEMLEKIVGDVLGWMKKEENREGRGVVLRGLVRWGAVGVVEMMM